MVDTALPSSSPVEADIARWFQEGYDHALRRAMRILPYDDARDAVQAVAVELSEQWAELPLEKRTVGYFVNAVGKRALEEQRLARTHQARYLSLDDGDVMREFTYALTKPSPLVVAEERSEYEYVLRQVRRLPPRVCDVWMLHYVRDQTPGEIAAILRIERKTVLNHLLRGGVLLRQRLTSPEAPRLLTPASTPVVSYALSHPTEVSDA